MKFYYVTLVLLKVFVTKVNSDEYCDFDSAHILCNATGIDVVDEEVVSVTFPKEDGDRDKLLKVFNDFRGKLASGEFKNGGVDWPKAANLMTLKWCEKCENAAWNILKACTYDEIPKCCDCNHLGDYTVRYLALESTSESADAEFDTEAVIGQILNQTVVFNSTCLDNLSWDCIEKESNIFMLVSDQVTHIGCAYTVCKEAPHKSSLLCYYNLDLDKIVDKPIYKQGEPCDSCLAEAECSTDFPSLCECKDSETCHEVPAELGEKCGKESGSTPSPSAPPSDTSGTETEEVAAEEGPVDFCKFNAEHVLCEATGIDVVDDAEVGFKYPEAEEDKEVILNAFNELREEIASGSFEKGGTTFPKASDMMKLKWCDDCEKAAWKMLKTCEFTSPPDCCDCTNTDGMYISHFKLTTDGSNSSSEFNIEDLMSRIVNKNTSFDETCIETITDECLKESPSFFILSSNTVSQVGCAYTKCSKSDNPSTFLCVLDFDATKAVDNPLYVQGDPCTGCRPNSQCFDNATALCECEGTQTCHIEADKLGAKCDVGGTDVSPQSGPQQNVSSEIKPEDKYCSHNPYHILCSALGIEGLDDAKVSFMYPKEQTERDKILNAMNEVRKDIASGKFSKGDSLMPKASGYVKLEWCDTCELAAWNALKECIYRKPVSCCDCSNEGSLYLSFTKILITEANVTGNSSQNIGENSSGKTGNITENPSGNLTETATEKSTQEFNIKELIEKLIVRDQPLGDGCLQAVTPQCFVDHSGFIMLASDEVTRVGCAYTKCSESIIPSTFLCFFDYKLEKSTNKSMYNQGEPCTNCTFQSQCADASQILCECSTKPCPKEVSILGKTCNGSMGIYEYHDFPQETQKQEQQEQQESKYCKYNVEHILCNATGIDVVEADKVSFHYPKDQMGRNQILDKFNKIREDIATGVFQKGGITLPQASNLLKLTWCELCENAAWNMLKDCQFTVPKSCCDCTSTGEIRMRYIKISEVENNVPNHFDSEEIFDQILQRNIEMDLQCQQILTWPCFKNHSTFAMVASAAITQIGCAYTECANEPFSHTFLCYFDFDFGRSVMKPLYSEGEPCSNCMLNSKCTGNSTILCECNEFTVCHALATPLGFNCTPETTGTRGGGEGPPKTPQEFCEYNLGHILCNATGIDSVDNTLVSFKFPKNMTEKEIILKAFNKIREEIASGIFQKGDELMPKAASLGKLKWCDECEAAAWNVLRTCTYKEPEDCCDCSNTGKMILKHIRSFDNITNIPDEHDLELIVEALVLRSKSLMEDCFTTVTPQCFKEHKNFLMIASDEITMVGCAYTECANDQSRHNLVCFFDFDFSKVLNNPLYIEGDPCGSCRLNSQCTEESPILCECTESEVCYNVADELGVGCAPNVSRSDTGGGEGAEGGMGGPAGGQGANGTSPDGAGGMNGDDQEGESQGEGSEGAGGGEDGAGGEAEEETGAEGGEEAPVTQTEAPQTTTTTTKAPPPTTKPPPSNKGAKKSGPASRASAPGGSSGGGGGGGSPAQSHAAPSIHLNQTFGCFGLTTSAAFLSLILFNYLC